MRVVSLRTVAAADERRRARPCARGLARWALVLLLPAALLACDGAEEREAAYFKRGKALYEAGDYRKASLEFRNARQINPLNVDALYYLGMIAEKQGDYRGAYKAFEAVTEQKPTHVGGNLHAGRLLLMSGDVEKAQARATKALEVEPDNIEARALRGAVNLRNRKLDAARADALFALGKDPKNIAATSVLVGVLQKENKADEAIALLTKTTESNKQETALRLLLIELYRRQKSVEGIEKVYHELFEIDPKNVGYRTDLARYLVAFGKKDEAETLLRAAVEAIPGDEKPKLVLIDFLANQRSFEQAEGALQQFIAAAPDNDDLKFGLAHLYVKHDQQPKAEAILHKIESNSKDKSSIVRARTGIARLRLTAGDIPGTTALVDKVLAEDSGNAEALILKARLLLNAGKRDEAIADLRSVLRGYPGNVEALGLVAQAHLAAGDMDLAGENLRLLLNFDPKNDEARMMLARISVRQGNPDKAVALVDEVLEHEPTLPAALRLREEILLSQRKLNPAMETAKRMLEVKGQEARGYVAIGRIYQVDGRHVEALESFRKAYAEDPSSLLALTGIVQSYLALKQPDDAVLLLAKVLKESPKNVYAQNMLGEVYAFKKVTDKAMAAFVAATELRKDWTLPYLNLSRLMMDDGKPEKAIEALKRGLQNIPNDATLKLTLATTQQRTKDFDGAMATYRSVLDTNPKLDVAANNLAALIADYKYGDAKSLDGALALAQRFQGSENPFYLDTLGWIHFRKGDYSLAVVFLTRAVESRPDQPQLNYHLGMAYLKAGNADNARRYLEKAVALGKDDAALLADANKALKTL
jgi:tetratricopeptide (TPR) repeat protein